MSVCATYTDVQLSELLKKGDHAAYEEFYERYWSVLYRHARKMLQNEEEARDVVQDVFVMLWTRHDQLTFSNGVPAFLYVAVRNKILDIFKRNKVAESHLASLKAFEVPVSGNTDHLIRERELSVVIEREIELLPKRMREVFELKRKSNLSYKEIAAEMKISELTVKTQMNKAIKALKIKLGDLLFFAAFPFL